MREALAQQKGGGNKPLGNLIILEKFLLFHLYIYIIGGCAGHGVRVEVRGQPVGHVPSCYPVGPGDPTPGIRLGRNLPYLPGHLAGPPRLFFCSATNVAAGLLLFEPV